MSDVDITLSLPEELVEKARARGVLNSRRIASLLEAEIERMESWSELKEILKPAREAFRADHANLTEEEVVALIDDIVHDRDTDPTTSDEGESSEKAADS